jgi:O-antigen ligase
MNLMPKFEITKKNYLNLLIFLFPLSFIAGNMIVNINIILIIFSSIILFRKDLFRINYYLLDKLLFSFFFLILLTGIINDFYFYSIKLAWKGYFATILKSFFFLKYLLLYIILRYLIEKDLINLKYFFLSCFVGTIFVSFDIIYQFFNGDDIFGFKGTPGNLAGPFGDELIAGGYIQRFSIFGFFLIPLFFQKSLNKYLKYIIPILFLIFFTTINLSGNRMPLLLFMFTIFLIIIFNKQTRKFFLPTLIVATIIFYLFINFNAKVNRNFNAFYYQIKTMSIILVEKDFSNKNIPPYLREFLSFYDTWLMHKYIGGGIKNFRYYCHKRSNIDKNSKFICNMHPHNYYLEILTETGILGFSIITLAFMIVIYLTLIQKYLNKSAINNNKIIIPFIFLFLVEIFPIKSTGSFFTTGNATYLFILMGILIGLMRKENLIENKS